MNVLLLNQTFYPDTTATAQQLADLAHFLKEKGCAVTVVADQRGYEARQTLYPADEVHQGIRILRVPSWGFAKQGFFYRMLDGMVFEVGALWKLMWVPRQDVVVAFTSPPLVGLVGALFRLLRGGHCVQWLMDVNPDAAIAVGYLKPRHWLTRFLVALFNFSLHKSDTVVVLDRWMKEKIVAHGVAAKKISVIPPWPAHEIALSTPSQEENSFRSQHGLRGKFVILYSGNHSIVHPLDTLLGAALRLRDAEDIRFVFIGGGLRVANVTDWKEKHQLENILQLPYQPRGKLTETLSSADLHVVIMGEAVAGLVHTSKLYGVLATGRPWVFIGPKKSHVADLLDACPCGYHVEHREVDRLVEVIRTAQKQTSQDRSDWGRRNTEFVTSHYAARISLDVFYSEVLKPIAARKQVALQNATAST